MRDGGKRIKPMEKEDLFTQMEMFMMVSGLTIKLMATEFTAILTGPNTRATGKKINNMETVSKHGLMEPSIKECMSKERNTDKEDLLGPMVAHTKENLSKITSKEEVNTTGPTAESTTASG